MSAPKLDTAAIRAADAHLIRKPEHEPCCALVLALCDALDAARAAVALTATHLASARAELERLRAGEDPTPVPENAWPTPGQWIRRFNEAPPEERLAVVARALEDARRAGDCFLRNHDGRIRHHDGALLELRAQRDALAAAVDGPFGAHEFTGPDGDGRTVCTGCSGVRANRVHRTARVILACLADGTDPRAHPFRADGDYDACDLNWCQEPADHPIHKGDPSG